MKTIPVLLSAALFAASAHADGKDIRLADCPPAVQETLRKSSRGGTIDEIESHTIDGRSLFVAEIDLPRDRELHLYVADDGSLVKTREDVSLAETPETVRNAIGLLLAKGGRADDIDKETAGETVTYRVEIDRKGVPDLEVILDAEGKVLQQREELDD